MNCLKVISKTDIGKKRENNEDSVVSLVLHSQSFNKEFNCGILVVADGIGGREIGEVASDIASKYFIMEVVNNILFALRKNEKINFSEILSASIENANNEIWKLSEGKEKPVGTTLVGAIVTNNHIYIVNVGDSRAYLVQPHRTITQITKDHTEVQEMVDNQVITKEQAKNHPRRNILTKALGFAQKVMPDIYEEEMNDGTLLLCSDGLYSMVDEEDIGKIINGNISAAAEELISLAKGHGGLDNISVALARLQ